MTLENLTTDYRVNYSIERPFFTALAVASGLVSASFGQDALMTSLGLKHVKIEAAEDSLKAVQPLQESVQRQLRRLEAYYGTGNGGGATLERWAQLVRESESRKLTQTELLEYLDGLAAAGIAPADFSQYIQIGGSIFESFKAVQRQLRKKKGTLSAVETWIKQGGYAQGDVHTWRDGIGTLTVRKAFITGGVSGVRALLQNVPINKQKRILRQIPLNAEQKAIYTTALTSNQTISVLDKIVLKCEAIFNPATQSFNTILEQALLQQYPHMSEADRKKLLLQVDENPINYILRVSRIYTPHHAGAALQDAMQHMHSEAAAARAYSLPKAMIDTMGKGTPPSTRSITDALESLTQRAVEFQAANREMKFWQEQFAQLLRMYTDKLGGKGGVITLVFPDMSLDTQAVDNLRKVHITKPAAADYWLSVLPHPSQSQLDVLRNELSNVLPEWMIQDKTIMTTLSYGTYGAVDWIFFLMLGGGFLLVPGYMAKRSHAVSSLLTHTLEKAT